MRAPTSTFKHMVGTVELCQWEGYILIIRQVFTGVILRVILASVLWLEWLCGWRDGHTS